MKSKKSQKRNKTKKGGFTNFFNSNKPSVVPSYCDPNQLSLIKGSTALHNNYQKCNLAHKNYMGNHYQKSMVSFLHAIALHFFHIIQENLVQNWIDRLNQYF